MPKIDVAAVTVRKGSGYPKPLDAPCAARTRRRLGGGSGCAISGVNLMTRRRAAGPASATGIATRTSSSICRGLDLTLVEDGGETVLQAGDCATFPKGNWQWPSPDQQIFGDGGLSGGGIAQPDRS